MTPDYTLEARGVLESFGSGTFPIDPVSIARKIGIKVYEADLVTNVSGALVKEKGKDPKIFLDKADHVNRRRFTCAHELGHYIYRLSAGQDVHEYEFVDYRTTDHHDAHEMWANQFAAELLMPENEVRSLSEKKYNIYSIATHFGVSLEAMRYRLNKLGLHS